MHSTSVEGVDIAHSTVAVVSGCEIGATLNTALVVMGDRLGYYRALAGAGPTTPAELAQRTATDAHYTREWLNA
jgi:SAM-dependent methyltransferase